MNCTHKHVRCDKDIEDELFGLLSSMRKLHAEKVTNGNMKPDRFIELFCDSHYFIGCDNPCCMNAHLMNMGIVRNLYTQEKELLDEFLYKEQFGKEDFLELLHRYLTARKECQLKAAPPMALEGRFTERQMASLTEIAHRYRLFLLPDGMDDNAAMTALLQCKPGFSVKVRNIRNMAVLFDELLAYNLVVHNRQSIMERGHFLLSPKSNKPVTASVLSSALNITRYSPTPIQSGIRKAVRKMQNRNITDE